MSERQKAAQARNPELLDLRIRSLRSITPEKRKQAGRKQTETRLAHVPPPFRDDYRTLIRKQVSKAEAMAVLQPRIDAWLGTHEGRMWRVARGDAHLVRAIRVTKPAAYVPTLLQAAMS